MRRLSDRFAEAAETCTSLAELKVLMAEIVGELGFHHFALLDHASLEKPAKGLVRLDNYPEGWVAEHRERGYPSDDPVHLASRRANTGFCWNELPTLISLDGRHKRILEESRRHGLGEGFTVPANVPGEPTASCSFVVRSGHRLPLERLHCAELVGAFALRAARRLRPRAPPILRPRLSRREVQCLRLLALGKTDWEIAHILGISVHTAHQYVKSARTAYGAVSRTQLVVYGLRDAWISFDDAIPPNW
jgi:LuxR family quorum-sensing system transcriptional regulator CciR